MDRRGFLGMLASLPVVAAMMKVDKNALNNVAQNIAQQDMPLGSSEAISKYYWLQGSGCMPKCSG